MPLVTSSKRYFVGGTRVRPGTPFLIGDKAKLSADMTLVEAPADPVVDKKQAAKPSKKVETFSEMAKQDHKDMTPKGDPAGADLV